MAKKIPPEKLGDEIAKILDEYQTDVERNSKECMKKVAQKGATALNAMSGATFKGDKYRKSWTYRVFEGRLFNEAVIYSKMPGLPHLLEHGHANANGDRYVSGRPHIKPIEEKLKQEFERQIRVTI